MAINSLRSLKADRFDFAAAQHLMQRAGFGGTPAQIRALEQMGLNRAVEMLVEYEQIKAPAVAADEFDKDIMREFTDEERSAFADARRSGNETVLEQLRLDRQRRQAEDRQQIGRIQAWWMKRLIETSRPFEEKMTLFWHGHFATGYRTIEDSYHMFMQNQLFRSKATGNFADLCFSIIRDPAMLRYLDNNQNRRGAPNENLARELMELFTLGEGNIYTEQDIKEAARALTGYTYLDDEFIFREQQHDPQPKRVMGQAAGDGDDLVRVILNQRIASEFLCWKFYRFFVNDLPGKPDADTQGFILKLARQLRDDRYDLKKLFKTLFKSEHFYDAANRACLIKSPVQLIVQGIRMLRTPTRRVTDLVSAADLMGQNLFFPPSVKGWDGGRAWINTSTMFVRQNLLLFLLTGRRPNDYPWQADGTPYDPSNLLQMLRNGAREMEVPDTVKALARFCFGDEVRDVRMETLMSFIESSGGELNPAVTVELLALITAMPEYQLC